VDKMHFRWVLALLLSVATTCQAPAPNPVATPDAGAPPTELSFRHWRRGRHPLPPPPMRVAEQPDGGKKKYTPNQLFNAVTLLQGTPDNPNAGTFGTWASAYAAALNVAPLLPTIVVDGSVSTPVMTPGNWDLGGFTLRSPGYFTNYTMNVMEGAHITLTRNDNMRVDGLVLNYQNTSTPVITSNNYTFILYNGAEFLADPAATAPFISGPVNLFARNQSAFFGMLGAPVLSSNTGLSSVVLSSGGTIQQNTFTGTGEIDCQATDPASILVNNQLVQTGATNFRYIPAEFSVIATLDAGTTTFPSGANLEHATFINCQLLTPIGAVGTAVATFMSIPDGNITLTSYGPDAGMLTTDNSVYKCTLIGAEPD